MSDTTSSAMENCKRCGRTYGEGAVDALLWNTDYVSGYATGLVCPNCQTATEMLGAQVDEIDLANSTPVDVSKLSGADFEELIWQTIEQRSRAVIDSHRVKGELAGNSHVEFNLGAWAAEAIDGAPLFREQPAAVQANARAAAADVIQRMLRLK